MAAPGRSQERPSSRRSRIARSSWSRRGLTMTGEAMSVPCGTSNTRCWSGTAVRDAVERQVGRSGPIPAFRALRDNPPARNPTNRCDPRPPVTIVVHSNSHRHSLRQARYRCSPVQAVIDNSPSLSSTAAARAECHCARRPGRHANRTATKKSFTLKWKAIITLPQWRDAPPAVGSFA